jgi:Tol biopolymer transport system component
MRQKLFVFIVFILILAFASSASIQQSAEQLYQSGIYKEEVEGQLEKAIEIYQTIVKQFPGNREIAAKAQLHIGLCYEKLGLKEALKAFQKVVENYPEQAEAVKTAKEKLSLILKAQALVEKGDKEFRIRKIWEGLDMGEDAKPSPDGRYLSYTDWDTGDLAIREIVTGNKKRLTQKGSWQTSPEFAQFSVWSSDGKRLAYGWYNKDNNLIELRTIELQSGEVRVLYPNKEMNVYPYDYSPDGKNVLVLCSKGGNYQIGLVSVGDSSLRIVKNLDWYYPWNIKFTEDSRYVIYDFPPHKDSSVSDIFCISLDGSHEANLTNHPAGDWVLGAVPNKKSILFASDRTGSLDAWEMDVSDGKLQGEPRLVKKDIGEIWPLGFTKEGSFFFGPRTRMDDIYIAEVNLASGKILSTPERLKSRFIGANFYPDWSPDGKYLAFTSRRGPMALLLQTRILCIHNFETGEERELFPKLNSIGRLKWSPDGRSILVTGNDYEGRPGLYIVDVQTGNVKLVTQGEPGAIISTPAWSPDGKWVYFYHGFPYVIKKEKFIFAQNIETGEKKVIYHRPEGVHDMRSLTISPDGKQLALVMRDASQGVIIATIPISGGEPRVLLKAPVSEYIGACAWTPDGRKIIYSKREPTTAPGPNFDLWLMSLEGGEPVKLGLTISLLSELRIHPDGQHIVFTSSKLVGEIWVMENFLPKEESNKK